ncbi:efflux transporter outer membrane subunit [Acidocella aromatica]|uniref:NodT family efflux transporter outer membrane factor (OMF) lipoprotein n=1 Tax=Acidocella aromatica TaxID=1303579 RepID=A0A840V7W4_9PROT|nr:efflux transporter outer membrane subunit [Acidocella aromatica]MBB5371803.1 NodT family efflux transporter outer membrane factor (OMF) lipoprotein [Acidocella aromatica]
MKWLSVLGALALTGCMVGPDYHKPALPVPTAYKTAPGWVAAKPEDGAPKGAWWGVFNDPVLNQLEPQVAVNNATLKADYFAYQQAIQIVQAERGSLFPSLGLTGSATRQFGSSGVGPSTSGTFEGSASWTIDIWGKIRRQVQGDVAAAQVSAADLANATLSVQAALAADYVDLRAADAAIVLYQQTVTAYQRSLRITENQAAAGTAAPSDVLTARTALEGAQSQLINAGAARAQYEHAIAVLTGHAPAELSIPAGGQIANVPVTPPGVPSTLLERRPDIAAAERTMAEENALIGVQVGAYYPDITLSALGGYAANPITGLFDTSSALWSLGADVSETVFEGGIRAADVKAAEYAYDQSVETYRQTVLNAFQGVENDLSNLTIYEQQAAVQEQAVADAARAVQIALNEYKAGTVAYTTVVQAQVTLLQDQQSQLAIQQNRLLASVALFQDLGGGFSAADLPSAEQIQAKLPFAP